jgi:hypothetical protein
MQVPLFIQECVFAHMCKLLLNNLTEKKLLHSSLNDISKNNENIGRLLKRFLP